MTAAHARAAYESVAAMTGPSLGALLLAQIDADERCQALLGLRADLVFHGDALHGLPPQNAGRSWKLAHTISAAVREIDGCIADEAAQTACDHNVWDGVSPQAHPLDSVAQMIRRHRADQTRRMFAGAAYAAEYGDEVTA